MDINQQIKILETLLKLPDNKECSDCHSKTPRWASITFGTFVCLRCSGQHRQLQVHITKIKSVNLDKWKPEMVEMYKHINNTIINSYWEANLPSNYSKPGQNASSHEVESFIRDKYINKRWIDTSMSADPASLYWNDRKKFDKYIKKITSGEESEDDKKKKKKSKKSKKSKMESEEEESEEEIPATKGFKAPPSAVVNAVPVKKAVAIDDLINLNAPSTTQQQAPLFEAGFSEFQDANPLKSTDNDFNDFQEAKQQQQQNNNNGINIQNLMNLYNQNPQFNQMQQPGQLANQLAQSTKYSALDAFSTQYNQQQNFQQQQQQHQAFNPFAGLNTMSQGNQMQRQNPTNGQFMGMMPQGNQPMGGGQQTNMFAGMNMTINVNQYGQMPQQQLPSQFNSFGGLPQNMMGQQQQNPMINTQNTFKPQTQFNQQPQINNQYPPQKQVQSSGQTSNMYGGLVNLSNLGTQANAQQPGGFGNQGSNFGSNGFSMGAPNNQGQKKDVFSGLMNNAW